jgi:hypothetical protein
MTGLGSLSESPVELAVPVLLGLPGPGRGRPARRPGLAYSTPYPRAEQLWLERAGLLLLIGWAAYATFSSDRTPQAAWMSAVTLGLTLLALVPSSPAFSVCGNSPRRFSGRWTSGRPFAAAAGR